MKETEGDGKGNSPKRMALLVIPVRIVIDRGNFYMYSLPSVTAWPIIITSIARSSLDGLLADVIPEDARGKAQANYNSSGLDWEFDRRYSSGFTLWIFNWIAFFD
jgi:hypothetical protein